MNTTDDNFQTMQTFQKAFSDIPTIEMQSFASDMMTALLKVRQSIDESSVKNFQSAFQRLSVANTNVLKDYSDNIINIFEALLPFAKEAADFQKSVDIVRNASQDFLKAQKQFDITPEEREALKHNEISQEQYVELPEDTFENISDNLITIPSDIYFSTSQKQILVKKSFYDFYCQCLIPTLAVLVSIIALFVDSPSPGSINNYSNTTIEQNAAIINNYFNIDDIDFENLETDSDHQNKILTPDSDPEDFDSTPEPESECVDNNP